MECNVETIEKKQRNKINIKIKIYEIGLRQTENKEKERIREVNKDRNKNVEWGKVDRQDKTII